MKTLIKNIFLLLCMITFITSCDKDGDTVYLEGLGSSELIATANDVVLTVENSKEVVLSLAWNNSTLLSSDSTKPAPAGILITKLQVSDSEDFSSVDENTVTSLSKAYTGTELNTLAKNLGIESGTSAPLYFRIASTSGDNITPKYSNICKVNVQPYTVDMSYLSVLNSSKDAVLGYLFSPEENGVYSGWIPASSWMNCWFKENDGTVWGNKPEDGHVFELSSGTDAWNNWFGDASGLWNVTVDTKKQSWGGTCISELKLNGENMTFSNTDGKFKYVIKTSSDDTKIILTGSTLSFSTSTGDAKANAKAGAVNFSMSDGKLNETETASGTPISKAGTYTVKVGTNEKAELVYTITEGAGTEKPEQKLPTELKMYNKAGDAVIATLTKTADGIYSGTYTMTEKWENFKLVDEENGIWYGSDPSDVYTLSDKDGNYNLWFGDDAEAGATVEITADLNTMKWKYTVK